MDARRAVCCAVAGHGTVHATAETLIALRQKPGPLAKPLPTSFLKHADEQAVAGLSAVYQAIHDCALQDHEFTRWGVLAAPRFLGRTTLAAALQRFAAEGAWGISPHLIPHHSQHAVSGTVSQALKIHGPNFGVGGGPGSAAEALFAATALVSSAEVPGVWVVLTGWDPEPIPGLEPSAESPPVCRGLALALVADQAHLRGPRLRIIPGMSGYQTDSDPRSGPTRFELETLIVALAGLETVARTTIWHVEGGCIELEQPRVRLDEAVGEARRLHTAGRWRHSMERTL